MAKKPNIPKGTVDRWQSIVNLIAQIIEVPAALIMRVHQTEIEVFSTSELKGNPYKKGEKAKLYGKLYCVKGDTVLCTEKHERVVVDYEGMEKYANMGVFKG